MGRVLTGKHLLYKSLRVVQLHGHGAGAEGGKTQAARLAGRAPSLNNTIIDQGHETGSNDDAVGGEC